MPFMPFLVDVVLKESLKAKGNINDPAVNDVHFKTLISEIDSVATRYGLTHRDNMIVPTGIPLVKKWQKHRLNSIQYLGIMSSNVGDFLEEIKINYGNNLFAFSYYV